VRVVSSKPVGSGVEVQCIGLNSERFYSRILRKDDLEKLRVVNVGVRDFSGDAEAFFLFVEGKRVRSSLRLIKVLVKVG
jgi:hypothetical protein